MQLILIRGLPGAGKSTLAVALKCETFSADDYFTQDNGEYKFNQNDLGKAHEFCQARVEGAMKGGKSPIIVTNTFSKHWEMIPYFDLANSYKYQIHTVIVENRHEGESIHNVPSHAIDAMRKRFEVKL